MKKPEELTEPEMTHPEVGWRFGVKVILWPGDPKPILNIYRLRRHKNSTKWKPQSKRQIYVGQRYWKELFGKGGIIERQINSYVNM